MYQGRALPLFSVETKLARTPYMVAVFVCLTPIAASSLFAGNFQRPVNSPHTVTQEYDAYGQVVAGKYHTAVDYTNSDSIARATSFGKVVRKQINGQGCAVGCNQSGCGCSDGGFGNTIILEHTLAGGQKVYSMYAHLAGFASGTDVNSCLAPGQALGNIGGSGYGLSNYWGAHLHFEIKVSNTLTNPTGSGTHFGYTPASADNYGYKAPALYILSPADQTGLDCAESSNQQPNAFSKSAPSNGIGVTSYSVNFDWSNSSDPDGDSVTYNLVVNDEFGGSVTSCAANGLSSSQRSCTLPQQANKNYYWQVWAVDEHGSSREASGPFWHLWTNTANNEPPNSFAKSSPANGTGVTGYAVNFDWSNSSDPDGDSVTYNLVVNDEFGGSVTSCAANGLSSSQRSCTLPQQANKNYYWQVWAVDEHGSSREATGPFWHLWTNTDTGSEGPPPDMLWKNAVRTDAARVTQLHGEFGTVIAGKTHTGVDISDQTCGSSPIYPVLPGTVEAVYQEGVWPGNTLGNAIVIRHSSSLFSLYAHMSQKSTRQQFSSVGVNDVLGTINETGTGADGCHLHLEIRRFPEPYFTLGSEDPSCNATYRCGDVRDLEYFLANWIDPVSPKIGQFDPVGAKPPGFTSSNNVPGWDISTNRYSVKFQGSYRFYKELYDAQSPKKNLGVPNDNGGGSYVHCWSAPGVNPNCLNGVWVQDLKRTQPTYQFDPEGNTSLILNVEAEEVFLLKEGFWSYYQNHDGFQNLGAPSSEESSHTGSPNFDGNAVVQTFERGALYYHPNKSYDRTPPDSDLITVLKADLTTPVSASQGWHIVGKDDEPIELYQNGNFLCQTPCDGIYNVDGWRYTITTKDVELQSASILPGSGAAPLNTDSPQGSSADPQVLLNDLTNFSYTAVPSGGTVVLGIRPPTERASVHSNGTEGNASSSDPSISGDGRYVAFETNASNLVAGDTNLVDDIFVRDRANNTTMRVSVSNGGVQGNDRSRDPSIDDSGRYIAFESFATNLVSGDSNGEADIFVHDLETGAIERVSVASDDTEGDRDSYDPSISADGRFVVFRSMSRDLTIPGGGGTHDNVIMHDRQTGETTLISISLSGTGGGNNYSREAAVSEDGRFVVFESEASNLVPNDTTGTVDILLRDVQNGTTQRVNVSSEGIVGNGTAAKPVISNDGRYSAYYSRATNLVPEDTNGDYDVFVYDRQTETTERVSVASDGTEGNGNSYDPSISTDGRYVTFQSLADNLVEGDSINADIFVHDRQLGTTKKISMTKGGGLANESSADPAISSDGRFVAFQSNATNLVNDDTNSVGDIFVRNRVRGPVQPAMIFQSGFEND